MIKEGRKKRVLKFNSMTVWMVIIILLLVLLGFVFSLIKSASEDKDYSDNRVFFNPAYEDFEALKFWKWEKRITL